ncbi:MAG: D-alanyl-D-alanine carboxypeptidase/D-alanyl-D-alanine-endopeptidase [Propionibacteriales bacterium]|nr:D-alanyl-D-alanine carboxypeptidase/D-alanyl-D-alanine-endopeptidase [Propionibacteriales bacterium]
MAAGEERHAARATRTRSVVLGLVPELLVVLVLVVAGLQLQFDLGHRWFGLERTDPSADPARVPAPAGLGLAPAPEAMAVASPLVPGPVDAAAVRAALAPLLTGSALGNHVALRVVDLADGTPVFRRGADAVVPASTMKLLTTAAALSAIGPTQRFSTRVLADGNRLVLVGGGDPFLASRPAAGAAYPARADLTTLAQQTAAALVARGIGRVTLGYDASLFSGPAVNPHWPDTYVPENVVPPISALWVDEAADPAGRYVADPARAAADAFVTALRSQKVTVVGVPRERTAPASATEVAAVRSAPLGEIVQQTLAVSDNNAAEVLARHVGLATGGAGSSVDGLRGVFTVLGDLGVDVSGSTAYDGSGLSRENELTATTLLDVLEVAASARHPELREVITGLPVAGFTGSLQRRFDRGPAAAQGRVRAKTGTLTGVHGLAGIATDLDGNLMAFVFVADRATDALAARHQLDLMAAALGACRCGA